MQKWLKALIAMICAICVGFNFMSISANEIDTNKTSGTDTPQVEVYDGFGNLVYECDTLDEAEAFINGETAHSIDNNGIQGARSVGEFLKLCKFVGKKLSAAGAIITTIAVIYKTVQYAQGEADFIDIIDQIVPASTIIELFNSGRSGYLYGTSAPNPYPPHSYQGATWIRSKTYYVIE